jgi:FKBP-type peptidyl-prolyl cis-trans isomerase
MIKYSYVLLGIALLCAACTKNERETPNGFKYLVLASGDGVLPKKDEIIIFDFLLKDSKDSVWSNTHTQGMPAAMPIGDSTAMAQEPGIVQMLRQLSKGDSAKASMDISRFFADIARGPVPPGIDTSLTIAYYVNVKDIVSREEFGEYQNKLMVELTAKQKGKDAAAITKYLEDKNIKAQQDTSGIAYVIHTSKGGRKPTIESCVEVAYKGTMLEDGQIFDQAPKAAFPLAGVIRGWQYAVPLIGVGDSATFYIPSGLAYGPQGMPGGIPPNAILIFDVKLLNVGNAFDQGTGICK